MNRKNMLVETVRERRGETFAAVEGEENLFRRIPKRVPVGVFVGVNDHGCIRIGWSRCKQAPATIAEEILNRFRPEEKQAYLHDLNDSDRFNFERGITEALRNILTPTPPPVHRGFARRFAAFKVRCERYFKNANFVDDTLVNGNFRSLNGNDGAAPELNALMKSLATIFGGSKLPLSLMVPGRLLGPLPKTPKIEVKHGPHGPGCRCK